MLGAVGRAFVRAERLNPMPALVAALLLSSCSSFASIFSRDPAPPPASVAQPVAPLPVMDATVWPTHGWREAAPEAEGLNSRVLASALATIRARHIPVNSLLIERHGAIVLDASFFPYTDDHPHPVFSVTKSVTSSLVGIALAEGRLSSVNATLASLMPDYLRTAAAREKSDITLAELLSMTSGVDCSDQSGRNFLQQMESSPDWVSFTLNRREAAEPGTHFDYCAGNMHLVSAVITRATGESAADYARARLFEPLGITDVSWPKDSNGVSHGFSDLSLTPRDMAKLGYLWLHHGQWEGRQIIPADYLADALTPHASVEPGVDYGYGMWIYPSQGHAGGPPDFEANGTGGQRIAVIPSEDMVVVITGQALDANDVASLICDAVKSDTGLPDDVQADSELETRLAEARSGETFRFASVTPQPRPESGVELAANTSVPRILVTPKPRPEPVGGVVLAANSTPSVLPKPRPDIGAALSLGNVALVRPLPRPEPETLFRLAVAEVPSAVKPRPRPRI